MPGDSCACGFHGTLARSHGSTQSRSTGGLINSPSTAMPTWPVDLALVVDKQAALYYNVVVIRSE